MDTGCFTTLERCEHRPGAPLPRWAALLAVRIHPNFRPENRTFVLCVRGPEDQTILFLKPVSGGYLRGRALFKEGVKDRNGHQRTRRRDALILRAEPAGEGRRRCLVNRRNLQTPATASSATRYVWALAAEPHDCVRCLRGIRAGGAGAGGRSPGLRRSLAEGFMIILGEPTHVPETPPGCELLD